MSITERKAPDRWCGTRRTGARPGKGVRKVLAIVPAAMVTLALLPLGQAGGMAITAPVAVIPDFAPSLPAGGQQAAVTGAAMSTGQPSTSSQVVTTPAPATTDHAADCAANHSSPGTDDAGDCDGDGSDDHAHPEGADHAADCAANHSGSGSDDAGDCDGDGADHSHAEGDDHAHPEGADHAADCAANHGGPSSGDATDCA